ncbi:MAG: thiamine diphosphokinase [Clostridia bacterium]|nr:thiamine diphosphokinase [Clostridia bacterium]
MKTCLLVGGGDFFAGGFRPEKDNLIIAVDAGYKRLTELGITPDIVVGDFDSLGFVPDHPDTQTHPSIKDDTDTMLAVRQGIEAGCDRFLIYGGTGGRIAHTLGNIQILSFLASESKQGFIIDKDYTVTAARNCTLRFDKNASGYISLLPWGSQSCIVTLKGLKYGLDRAPLPCDRPLGISNEFTGKAAEITVHGGTAVIIIESAGNLPEREENDGQ